MSKYEVIEKIMNSTKIKEYTEEKVKETKVNYIQTFLLGWITEDDLKWLWKE